MIATFFEATWAPPPRILLKVPHGFDQPSVFLLQDANAPTRIDWTGSELPFIGLVAEVAVPRNGVLRVRSFGALAGRADAQVDWSDGRRSTGAGGGPATPEMGADLYLQFDRREPTADGPAQPATLEEVAREVRTREATPR